VDCAARARLWADLRAHAFGGGGARRIGAEVELLALAEETGAACPIWPEPERSAPPSTLAFLRRLAARRGWAERPASAGGPAFVVPGQGVLSFEPGGQLEYSTVPCETATALVENLAAVVPPLRAAAREEGIALVAAGLDPVNPLARVPLRLRTERYLRMDDYFATIGPAGARMMRQTAALQVSVDAGGDPGAVWRALNAAAPVVVSLFANSPADAGRPAGRPSARAALWRAVDPLRTGLFEPAPDPAAAYLDFALRAPAFLLGRRAGAYRPFAEWLDAGAVGIAEWRAHLSTLFPEVRPRGHFEVRSADAVEPEAYPAAVALLAALAYDPAARREAEDVLGPPDPDALRRASERGMDDPALARAAAALAEIALRGAARLGPAYFAPAALEAAADFFRRYALQGRSPSADGVWRPSASSAWSAASAVSP